MILATALSKNKHNLSHDFNILVKSMEKFLEKNSIREISSEYLKKHNCFFIGRGLAYDLSLEAALKVKEVTYIQTEGFASGELKHGTIALIEENTPVFALIIEKNKDDITRSNLKEVESRGAKTKVITLKSLAKENDIFVEDVNVFLAPILLAIPTQLLTYYSALERGFDIDMPRNLAKSVTVE